MTSSSLDSRVNINAYYIFQCLKFTLCFLLWQMEVIYLMLQCKHYSLLHLSSLSVSLFLLVALLDTLSSCSLCSNQIAGSRRRAGQQLNAKHRRTGRKVKEVLIGVH